ncbi:lisH domain-containing protein isoform X1 [Populus alba x Populus x berolinensis]|uniref:LisH domain-containing protein isoform X1 n=1 Tax=Populus alba x Populus x berolinensis TaxID=444605 RepID=A0AAD6LGY9_9ROSI|nr:lisH domain-containing protein isoform X1 [Populus alba x Populus x berolinensis]
MIKRRFFKAEHGEKDEASSDSSSSSDSEAEASGKSEDDVVTEPEENSESEDGDTLAEPKEDNESEASSSSSSGYESEDSSANAIDGDSSDDETEDDRKTFTGIKIGKKQSNIKANEESVPDDIQDCILKCKSVYKCRICPRIICLTEETMRAHLNSKRHSRSKKLMKENRLKVMLNSDGEIENMDQETHAERHARTLALAQGKTTKKNKGRQRQRKRLKKRVQAVCLFTVTCMFLFNCCVSCFLLLNFNCRKRVMLQAWRKQHQKQKVLPRKGVKMRTEDCFISVCMLQV